MTKQITRVIEKIKKAGLKSLRQTIISYRKWEDENSKNIVKACLMETKKRFGQLEYVNMVHNLGVEHLPVEKPANWISCELCKDQGTHEYKGKHYCSGHYRKFVPSKKGRIVIGRMPEPYDIESSTTFDTVSEMKMRAGAFKSGYQQDYHGQGE